MLLNEFFGKPLDPIKDLKKNKDDRNIDDDLFWFIIDHDKLHKDYFHPVAKKIHHSHKNDQLDKEAMVKEFMPMVKKGCMEYYHHKQLTGKLGKIFHEELRKDMCERLFDHYKEDIIKDSYKIGR